MARTHGYVFLLIHSLEATDTVTDITVVVFDAVPPLLQHWNFSQGFPAILGSFTLVFALFIHDSWSNVGDIRAYQCTWLLCLLVEGLLSYSP